MKPFIFRTLVVLSFFAGLSGETSAQNSVEVPVNITTHFNAGFTNASTVSWKKSSATGYFVADFIQGLDYKRLSTQVVDLFCFPRQGLL